MIAKGRAEHIVSECVDFYRKERRTARCDKVDSHEEEGQHSEPVGECVAAEQCDALREMRAA